MIIIVIIQVIFISEIKVIKLINVIIYPNTFLTIYPPYLHLAYSIVQNNKEGKTYLFININN